MARGVRFAEAIRRITFAIVGNVLKELAPAEGAEWSDS